VRESGRVRSGDGPAECTCPPLQPNGVAVTQDDEPQGKVPGERYTSKSRLIPETYMDTRVRRQGPGRSPPGPGRSHPLHGAGVYGQFP